MATRKPLLDQPRQIGVERVVRHAAHRNRRALPVFRARGQRQVEGARGDERVFVEHLVEVAHPKEQNRVAILLLRVEILPHRRRDVRCVPCGRRRTPCGRHVELNFTCWCSLSTRQPGREAWRSPATARVLATFAGDAAITHGERLPGDLMRVLDTHGLRVGDVDLFAVAAGPGSFTGLRIGIATMQGLALANGKPLAGMSALDAIHEAVSSQLSALSPQPSALSPVSEVAVWMDAQRGQVFSAVYRDGVVVETALVEKPGEILARWAREGVRPSVFAGDGAHAYQDLIRAADPVRTSSSLFRSSRRASRCWPKRTSGSRTVLAGCAIVRPDAKSRRLRGQHWRRESRRP